MSQATFKDKQELRENLANKKVSAGTKAVQAEANKQTGGKAFGSGVSLDTGGGDPGEKGGRDSMKGKIGIVTAEAGTREAEEQKEKIRKEGKNPRFLQPRDENGQFANNSRVNMHREAPDRSKGRSMQNFMKNVDLTCLTKHKDEGYATFRYLDDEGNAQRIMQTFEMDELRLKESLSTYMDSEQGFLGFAEGFVERAKQGRRSKEETETEGEGYTGHQKSLTSKKIKDKMDEKRSNREFLFDGSDAVLGNENVGTGNVYKTRDPIEETKLEGQYTTSLNPSRKEMAAPGSNAVPTQKNVDKMSNAEIEDIAEKYSDNPKLAQKYMHENLVGKTAREIKDMFARGELRRDDFEREIKESEKKTKEIEKQRAKSGEVDDNGERITLLDSQETEGYKAPEEYEGTEKENKAKQLEQEAKSGEVPEDLKEEGITFSKNGDGYITNPNEPGHIPLGNKMPQLIVEAIANAKYLESKGLDDTLENYKLDFDKNELDKIRFESLTNGQNMLNKYKDSIINFVYSAYNEDEEEFEYA